MILEDLLNVLRNKVLNMVGVERDLTTVVTAGDIDKAKEYFENHDEHVNKALKEYNPEQHEVMFRPDKPRKGKDPRAVQKLPRNWQSYINEIALFFLLAKPIRWKNENIDEQTNKIFDEYKNFLRDTRFDVTMRQAKRIAGSETMSAKLYHIYNENGKPKVKVIVLAASEGYVLRPLRDQYKNLVAFGYGYHVKENDHSVEHFDIQTAKYIYRCKRKATLGWEVTPIENPTGKINVILYEQKEEWRGAQPRISRDEMSDSKSADINDYFADPMAAATADVISSLADPDAIGKLITLSSKESEFKYVEPPTASEMKDIERKTLRESIHQDTLTPDFSYESLKGIGTLSGEALRRALALGYIKRDNLKEIYDIGVDREKNLILAIMEKVTHIGLKGYDKVQISHEFAEPFDEDSGTRIDNISTAYTAGIASLETAVSMLGFTNDVKGEIARIMEEQAKKNPQPPQK